MATLGDSKFDLSIKYNLVGSANTKTKSINYINYNSTGAGGGSSALGLDTDALYTFASLINTSLIGGTVPEFTLNEGRIVSNG